MTHYVKAWILALGLILTPAAASAQDAQPEAAATEEVAEATDAAASPSGLDPALYVPMKPTPGVGMPVQGGIDFQPQVSATGKQAKWINNAILLPIITVISLFVLALLFWVMIRYRRGANPEPSKTTHNTFIEIVWTVIPVLILLVIAVPSISLLAKQFEPAPEDALTVKITGYQWYWGYSYPDNGDFEIISNMLPEDEAKARGEPFQLAVDNRMVIPVGKPIKMLVTGADVIHSFALPAAWFKLDAVPGRINEKVMQIDEVGVYYGQCSELCGARHGFMPITVEVLPEDKFNDWVRANGGTVSGDETETDDGGEEAAETAEVAAAETTDGAAADAAAAAN
ncbi:cytochrome c oxidase subunit 2 [Parasphingorhabdus marina DSM 22363]|uniref:Cytochrome c oxidase subunit 2 n=1 Tax=Parasphingorhabdus marina DSM 22363 TaxID=1123272 RepID=A0A1N6CX35_9SPHN|nr:cytochrome c oxidase subunit II [Parasphingorhabdus marina]SIN63082.1 cytochrome c oxidase subunit 2 [Parasphingorhabdus marina DSM 22363]